MTQQDSLRLVLVRIETKVDLLIANDGDKEKRIRKLERRDGIVAGASGIAAILSPIVWKKLFGL
ncbi:MAG TPA: hypothetical protein VG146_01790 [Verrucomicrobiae bacterium]|nr:hypothetical protein [Verrucomicrobiae bacterium]